MSNAAYEVGRIHVRQENPPILTRCTQDRPGAFYGIELTSQNGTQRVMWEALILQSFVPGSYLDVS